jgi:site-specific recombinase XerD
VRLDDAVTYFLGGWTSEGPRVPTRDTVRVYSKALRWLVDFALARGKRQLADLTPELLRAALREKMEPKAAHHHRWKGGEAAANQVACATRALAKWLLAQGVPVADGLLSVRPPRVPERIQPRVSRDEFLAIEAAILRRLVDGNRHVPRVAVARDLALVYLLSDTGLRAAEVCGMRLNSVDLVQGWVQVRGKYSKERALSIADPDERDGGGTVRLLGQWIDERARIRGAAQHQWLWTSMKGNQLTPHSLRRILDGICQAAGVRGNRPPHAFRRAHFSEAYRENPGAVRLLAARMGWSPQSHEMINVYTRGAEIELTRLQPVPLVSKRWRQSPDRAMSSRQLQPLLDMAVGARGRATDDPAPPLVKGRREPGRFVSSRRSPRP